MNAATVLGYDPDDDLAADKLIDRQLRNPHKTVWAALSSPEYVEQTARILQSMDAKVIVAFTHARNEWQEHRADFRNKVINGNEFQKRTAEYNEWRGRAAHFQAQVRQRLAEVTPALLAARRNIETDLLWKTVASLARAVAEHRLTVDDEYEPTDADRLLWMRMESLRIPFKKNNTITLAEFVERVVLRKREVPSEAR